MDCFPRHEECRKTNKPAARTKTALVFSGPIPWPWTNISAGATVGDAHLDAPGLGAIRRDLPGETAVAVDALLRRSVEYALAHPEASGGYVRELAQEMDDDVIASHIELYVNKFTVDMGRDGEAADATG